MLGLVFLVLPLVVVALVILISAIVLFVAVPVLGVAHLRRRESGPLERVGRVLLQEGQVGHVGAGGEGQVSGHTVLQGREGAGREERQEAAGGVKRGREVLERRIGDYRLFACRQLQEDDGCAFPGVLAHVSDPLSVRRPTWLPDALFLDAAVQDLDFHAQGHVQVHGRILLRVRPLPDLGQELGEQERVSARHQQQRVVGRGGDNLQDVAQGTVGQNTLGAESGVGHKHPHPLRSLGRLRLPGHWRRRMDRETRHRPLLVGNRH
mmetsp:Transcript_56078/g.162538  ORF Transcript_56078/g.162538 Transcript_56078/m.162538 type:complete len:265 (-) Transcript_56078:113-907(-)